MEAEKDSNSPSSTNGRQNISFKFTKSTSKPLSGNRLEETSSESKDYVLSVDKSEIKSTLPREESKQLVIPLIKENKWRKSDSSENKEINEETKIKQLAIEELLKETSEKNAEWENRESNHLTINIPLIMQNKVPEGYETDYKLDVSLRPDTSTMDDYENIPVNQYGWAMLRGMGLEDAATGANKKNKNVAQPIEVQVRPKGLGLGADASVLKKSQKKAKEEKLELIKGAYVNITQGPLKGHYGEVVGLDEENARAIIKLSSEEKLKSFPEFFFDLVSKKEFNKEKRIMNRTAYENQKRINEKREQEKRKQENDEENNSKNQSPLIKKEKRDITESYEKKSKKHKKHSKERADSREKSLEKNSCSQNKAAKLWIRPELRVRFIDDKYKKGKYFNKKLVVVDVLSPDNCSCKTEDDRTLLDDISPSMLETVIPRDESAYVMIVQGKYSGELCTILTKDKANCIATVQFLSDRNQALKIDYDSICEYVGDVSQYD